MLERESCLIFATYITGCVSNPHQLTCFVLLVHSLIGNVTPHCLIQHPNSQTISVLKVINVQVSVQPDRRSIKPQELTGVSAPLPFSHPPSPPLSDKKLKSCSCRHVQLFAFQHPEAPAPLEYRMCEVSAARNVPEHVYTMVFVCRNRLNDQWVEVAGDLSALIRNL